MVSLRFPFSSFPPPPNPNSHRHSSIAAACTAFAVTGAAVIAITQKTNKHPFLQNPLNFILNPSSSPSPFWGSLSLSSNDAPVMVETKTGVSFPSVIKGSQKLMGVGLRRKSIFGLKNIDVYAFGIYADEDHVQKCLNEKYGKLPASDLKGNRDFNEDLLASDVDLTIRLQIVYSKLSIKSVRSAFEESVGSRLQKFGGPDNKELLHRFTSQFRDEVKLPKGAIIELSRERSHVLRTTIDGVEQGSIQSQLLCQSVSDLYIGEDPFDRQAKDDFMHKLANVFEKKNAPLG